MNTIIYIQIPKTGFRRLNNTARKSESIGIYTIIFILATYIWILTLILYKYLYYLRISGGHMKERIKHLLLFIILIGIDQGSKIWVRTVLAKREPIIIIPKVLNLQYQSNSGAAWGIFSGKVDFLKILTIIALLIILYLYFKIPEGKRFNALKLLTVFIVAGAAGNLIDRFYLGYVVDFVYFEIIDFPLFNFADTCLTVASFVMFFLALFYFKDDDFAFLEKAFRGKKGNAKIGTVKKIEAGTSDTEEEDFDDEDFGEEDFDEEEFDEEDEETDKNK